MRPLFRYRELLEYEEPIRPYLIHRLLHPGSKMLMGGTAKRGKSFILHGLVHALATGTPLFGRAEFDVPVPFPGIMFSQELWEGELKRRWSMYSDLPTAPTLARNLVVCPKNLDYRLDRDEGVVAMREQIAQAAQLLGRPLAWIALDPMSKFHHANENDQREMGLLMRNVERLQIYAERAAVIMVHHFGHPSEAKLYYRQAGGQMRGSTELYANVDTLMSLTRLSPLWARNPKFKAQFEIRQGEPVKDGWIRCTAERMQPLWEGEVPDAESERPADPEYGEGPDAK